MSPRITFARLPEIDPELIRVHMSDPRMAEHMPLLTGPWSPEIVARFVAAKEGCWQADGLGHQAFLADGRYVGWGGLQKEGTEWDLGLVLVPTAFGLGPRIARKILEQAVADPRVPFVTFLLPPSRRHLGALSRLGAEPVGEVQHAAETFLKFRLPTAG